MRFGECGICDQGENSGSVCTCDEGLSPNSNGVYGKISIDYN